MPANARKDLVREGEIGTYHCWSRCVQRAFLCGCDPDTGQDFDYRRGWLEDLLAYQARVFAIDVGNFNVLSNHAHTILRTRPDLTAAWSAEEIALRWKMAWPEFLDGQWVREPTDEELDRLLAKPERIEQIRRNLSSLSWFMARWKEPMARLCNAEFDHSGHFWEARFKCRELLDDEAVLTCSIYVDLNQLRAEMADSLEQSRHSAIRQRILAAKERESLISSEDFRQRDPLGQFAFSTAESVALFADCALAPIAADGPLLTTDSRSAAYVLACPPTNIDRQSIEELAVLDAVHQTTESSVAAGTDVAAAGSSASPTCCVATHAGHAAAAPLENVPQSVPRRWPKLTRRRASDAPFMAVAWSEYLRVVNAMASRVITGKSTRIGKDGDHEGGAGDSQLRDTLERWGMNPTAWLTRFEQLDHQCARALGVAQHVLERARGLAQQRFHGIRLCREIFAASVPDGFT